MVAENISIANSPIVGHEFDLRIEYDRLAAPAGAEGGDCKLTWREWTDHPHTQQAGYWAPNTWKNLSLSPTLDPFRAKMNEPYTCPTAPQADLDWVVLHDTPGVGILQLLGYGVNQPGGWVLTSRYLAIEVTIEGAEGCNCSPNKIVFKAVQKLEATANSIGYGGADVTERSFEVIEEGWGL